LLVNTHWKRAQTVYMLTRKSFLSRSYLRSVLQSVTFAVVRHYRGRDLATTVRFLYEV